MDIPLIAVFFYALFVGIPAIAGTYTLINHDTKKEQFFGILLLFYSIALGSFITYLMPVGKFSGADNTKMFPLVVTVSILAVAVPSFISRRKKK